MANEFRGEYSIEGAGPDSSVVSFRIPEREIEDDATEDDLREVFEQSMQHHFELNIYPYEENLSEFITWARGTIEARKA